MRALIIKNILLFILFIASMSLSQGAIRLDADTAKEIKSLRSSLEEKKGSISKLNEELKTLEGQLGQHNERYVQVIRLKRKIESEIYSLKARLEKGQVKVEKQIDETKKVLRAAILGRLDSSHSPSMLLGEKIVFEHLEDQLGRLVRDREHYSEVKEKLKSLENRYVEYHSVERELASILAGLEGQRELTATSYIEVADERSRLQSEYDSFKTKIFLTSQEDSLQARDRIGGVLFSIPIERFGGMEHQDKGVTFRYRGQRKVLNAAEGTVVYKGKLSTYGNVVMVDHGNDTRSVFLGHFQPSVKKGKILQRGDLIGQTRRGQGEGELYFEVRKHNEVQNTILLLDQERLLASVLDSRT